jgi:hypothetical protein
VSLQIAGGVVRQLLDSCGRPTVEPEMPVDALGCRAFYV